ncbi:alpha-L-fucosidase [Neorhodopirellula lusitana]|uniref:alpha-L-fucosidase n=1 Tax=Neorhodopirellula lusitana TaxID=445327 RepID=UPI00384BFFF7
MIMKRHISLFAVLLAITSATAVAQEIAKPSAKQIRFADWEVGAFFHYTLNPFTDQEHGDGQEPPSKFNPTELDVEQWILTAKSMGARYAVLTARHEGGFCLWPSKTTDYTIANSPFRNGNGDLVREFVNACRKHGLGVGLYHTAGFDANAAIGKYEGDMELPLQWSTTWGKAVSEAFRKDPTLRERFKIKQVEQMRELLTWYGPIDFMWSDHWDATDPNGVWRAVTNLARELQPELVFMGPDTWVPGNETGHVVYPMWNAVNTVDGTENSRPAAGTGDQTTQNSYGLLEGDVRKGDPLGKYWRVRECTTHMAFHYGGWFWHPDHVKKTYPRQTWEHLDLYYRTVGLGANTIINLPPNTRGLIPDNLAAAAKKLGDEIRNRFSQPIATTNAVQTGDVVELNWDQPQQINTVVTMENIEGGQKIAKYTLEAFVDGHWETLEPRNRLVAQKPYNGDPGYETIGHKKIDRVKPVPTNRVRLRCLQSITKPIEIRSLAVFDCEPITRTYEASYPYLSGIDTLFDEAHGSMKRDLDYRGGPLELGGTKYEHGILLCPVGLTKIGIAEFDMTRIPKAKGMTATIGIEDMTASHGSCKFIVEGKVDQKWQELYHSPLLRGGSKPIEMAVKFPKGMEQLRLKTTDGGDNANSDHALWADAKFTQ